MRFAAGEGNLKALNPGWDNTFLDQLAANDLDAIDTYTNDSIKELGGQSGQEIRNWIAAYSALSTAGPYDLTYRYYRPGVPVQGRGRNRCLASGGPVDTAVAASYRAWSAPVSRPVW